MKPNIDFEKIVEAAQLYRPDVLSPYVIMGELVGALTSQIAIAESAERILDNWRRNIYRKKKNIQKEITQQTFTIFATSPGI